MTTLSELSNESYIDTRDLQDRIDELERLCIEDMDDEEREAWTDEQEELDDLLALKEEIGDYVFENQETLIRESEINDYLIEMVHDIGDLPKELPSYIESNINWDGVVEDLLQDYSEVEIDGTTFYYRNY